MSEANTEPSLPLAGETRGAKRRSREGSGPTTYYRKQTELRVQVPSTRYQVARAKRAERVLQNHGSRLRGSGMADGSWVAARIKSRTWSRRSRTSSS